MPRSWRSPSGPLAIVLACAWICSCSGSESNNGATGGTTRDSFNGGTTSSGGVASSGNANSSGAIAVGGTPAAGTASTAAGGAASTAAGGTKSSGGAASTAGGAKSSGGVGSSAGGNAGSASDAGAGATDSSAPRTLFFLDVQGRVLALDEDKPSVRTLVSSAGQGPDGIAIDRNGGHIFWTTMGVPADNDGSLRRAALDGSKVSTIVAVGDTYTPKQLKLDSAGQKLYWSDREGMRIQRSAIDGSGLETLVTVATGSTARQDAANWCVGMALDLTHGFLYWTQKGPDDGMVGSIRRAHIEIPAGENAANRSDIEVLFDKLPEPVDLDLDVAGGFMYWSDRGDDTINRAPIEIPAGKTAATRGDRQILVRGVSEAIGVTLDLERGHIYYTSGAAGRVGRANLDGSDARDLIKGSGAFTGIAVLQQGTP